jgi:integrase
MPKRIDSKSHRAKLRSRRNPYFQRLRAGFHLGFRATEAGGIGTWIARRLVDHEYHFKSLGEVNETVNFEAAVKLAETWAAELDRGVGMNLAGRTADVSLACTEYVDDVRRTRPKTAHDAELRFKRRVHGHPIGRVPLDKLRAKHVTDWHYSLPTDEYTQASADRDLAYLRAALNRAVDEDLAPSHMREQVRRVKPFGGKPTRREVFLDQDERRRLLEAASGSLRDLIEAAALTGARPGELVNARISAFDKRNGFLNVTGKTGPREIALSPPAIALFTRLSKDKIGEAFLLTRENGECWKHPKDWARPMKEAVARAGLDPDTVLYSLRHSFISELLDSGMSTFEVSELVGTSLVMIQKRYGKFLADRTKERLAKVAML